jgi:hypothetical protein
VPGRNLVAAELQLAFRRGADQKFRRIDGPSGKSGAAALNLKGK